MSERRGVPVGARAWADERLRVWASSWSPERKRAVRHARDRILGKVRRPVWGNVRRRHPFSVWYGADRGTPVDRFYMLQFLRRHAPATGSRILEVERPEWTERLGLADATVDVLDIDPHNLAATVLADLGQAGTLDESSYDGILLMQTLQYVEHPGDALANAYLALAPGGRLLLSVPTISRIDEMCGPTGDRWRWTPAGLRSLVGSALGDVPCTVEGFGTLPAATAFLLGVPAEQMRPRDLWPSDDRFPVVACARVDKPGE